MTTKPTIRCAIYTRKSTNEGLDQAFNSLDAQREACSAYISSQRHEGWRLVKTHYDDGGQSGGSLDRPALERLLSDIDSGQIGMVVVYKIDRLTRSLADFAKLVDRLDDKNCSFVSVTQAFNTSSSMGRLTLNVLLSFAQFEREVTAERIRDKIAASKKKGMWMGGMVPLGYDTRRKDGRSELVINRHEAEQVRQIFDFYYSNPNLAQAEQKACEAGIVSKKREFESGAKFGGKPLSRGQIHFILTNPIYTGMIKHKQVLYDGQHHAIIDKEVFDRIQAKLAAASNKPRSNGSLPARRSPLCGRLFDETGDRLTPTHTKRKNGKRYRYYVSNRLLSGSRDKAGWRLPADPLENELAAAIHQRLQAQAHRLGRVHPALVDVSRLLNLIDRAKLSKGCIAIQLNAKAVENWLGRASGNATADQLKFEISLALKRRGVENRVISGQLIPAPDAILIRALAKAHKWLDQYREGSPLHEIAAREKMTSSYIRNRACLALLSPKIQSAIVNGTQPADLSLERLMREGIPADWAEQERKFGFA
jgi:DNA invertase Pin-like site-specific DNA recombinase